MAQRGIHNGFGTTISPTDLACRHAGAGCRRVGASPARADRCEDTAKELKNQIDGIKISVNTGNMIYLTHPAAKELSLGCRGRNYSVELYAKADRKPKPQFFDLIASAGAIIFTIPKPDALTGTSRCIKRMGFSAATRFRCATAASTWNARGPRPRLRSW